MESVGKKLRDARLRKKLALEDVSAITRINLRNLQAIEADDIAQISSPFTYRSFARQFASGIGLDWKELEQAACEMSGRIPEPLVPGQDGAPAQPGLPSLRSNKKPTHRLRWTLSLGSLGLTLGVCATFHAAWQTARSDLRGSVAAITNTLVSHPSEKPAEKPVSRITLPSPAPVTSPAEPNPNSFRIELSALENCWLSVITDGKEVFSGVLQPTQTKILDGQEEARIRTGNAGGVEVNFNGKALGTLGRRGEVRTVVFTKNGYEVLQSSAHLQLSSALITLNGE
jgi:Domain of unknown function (DUF4115)/Helix-turn-helix domain